MRTPAKLAIGVGVGAAVGGLLAAIVRARQLAAFRRCVADPAAAACISPDEVFSVPFQIGVPAAVFGLGGGVVAAGVAWWQA